MWLGIACAILGPILYAVQLHYGRFDVPWYAPALATLGFLVAFVALRRRTTVWRVLALLFVGALAGLQWWFLASHARLTPYAGPVVAGKAFPEFTVKRADGSPFSRVKPL